jgi:hypothetical protein
MQLAPKLPPETDWDTLDPTGRYGVVYIGKDHPLYKTEPGDMEGILTYTNRTTGETVYRPGAE